MYGCSSKASGVCGLSTVLDAELACAAQEVPYGALPPLSTNVNPQCVHSHSRLSRTCVCNFSTDHAVCMNNAYVAISALVGFSCSRARGTVEPRARLLKNPKKQRAH